MRARLLVACAVVSAAAAQSLQLPSVPYAYDALEPFIDTRTMIMHHLGNHKAYTDKLNTALETLRSKPETKQLAKLGIDTLLTRLDDVAAAAGPALARQIRNQGGGYGA
jgi:Fe-Mn family superoxide dismutase